jgi:hypothetical protein
MSWPHIICSLYNDCHYADPSECDLAKLLPVLEKLYFPFAPLYMKFTCLDWFDLLLPLRHIYYNNQQK